MSWICNVQPDQHRQSALTQCFERTAFPIIKTSFKETVYGEKSHIERRNAWAHHCMDLPVFTNRRPGGYTKTWRKAVKRQMLLYIS